jgi:hypothetical protein
MIYIIYTKTTPRTDMPAAPTAAPESSATPKKKIAKLPAAQVKKPVPVKKPAKTLDAAAAVKAEPKKAKAKAAASDKPAEPKEKVRKPKLVRDSFTMPEDEYAGLGEVKKACLKAGLAVKKSELLRVGVSLVRQLDIEKLKEIVASLPVLKAGRPKKSK